MVSSVPFVNAILILACTTIVLGVELRNEYNVQVYKEFLASNTYLTFAQRLASEGFYQGFAHFFFESAEEERDHGKKLIEFANLRNWKLSLPRIPHDAIANSTTLTEMIYKAQNLEQQVYKQMNAVINAARDESDYTTIHFFEREMLEEQITAVKYMNDLVKRMSRLKDSTIFLQMLDQNLRDKKVKQA
jgi:ferritin